jgi:DNA-binding response OmpR family regulator
VGNGKARVLVVDDDQDLCAMLDIALSHEGYVVHTASDSEGAVKTAEAVRPDLVILDVHLNGDGIDGFAVSRTLRSRSDVPILFCTAAQAVEDRLTGFGVGADDYVVKPFAVSELLARMQALLRRAGRTAGGALHVADLVIDQPAHVARRGDIELDLTPLEFSLLAALAEQPGRVFAKRELLDRVWGFDGYDVNVVERHVSDLRTKLEAHGPRLIWTVRGIGYTFRA